MPPRASSRISSYLPSVRRPASSRFGLESGVGPTVLAMADEPAQRACYHARADDRPEHGSAGQGRRPEQGFECQRVGCRTPGDVRLRRPRADRDSSRCAAVVSIKSSPACACGCSATSRPAQAPRCSWGRASDAASRPCPTSATGVAAEGLFGTTTTAIGRSYGIDPQLARAAGVPGLDDAAQVLPVFFATPDPLCELDSQPSARTAVAAVAGPAGDVSWSAVSARTGELLAQARTPRPVYGPDRGPWPTAAEPAPGRQRPRAGRPPVHGPRRRRARRGRERGDRGRRAAGRAT